MRMAALTSLVLIVAFCGSSASSGKDKPLKTAAPLSADEVAVYKALLQQYSSKEAGNLHVSNTTYPLNSDSPREWPHLGQLFEYSAGESCRRVTYIP
jgi:hypothetical protein